ncbi:DeoR/GlpR family DNA-binding transcription regulator [Chthonobacter albigriseus]|uniref:DeoR/GlpR family DNA-binding transcription regulator n=1 Tax=Chthonobacter albigriseus TaxID=1683161 RepID=UPI0015EF309C|nr:DeoR/GlpR family DNA-binding transcription regulator [Chthonobacter albigriseus]
MQTDPSPFPNSLSPYERQEQIVTLLGEKGRLAVASLADRFRTSDDSIRRDLRTLAAAGRIRRVHGAVLPAAALPQPFSDRLATDLDAKRAIGRAAAALVRPGSVVFLDGGTTVLAAAEALPPDLAAEVVTTSPPVALALADHPRITVILIGGILDKPSRTVVGSAALDAVRAIRADLCLIGLCSLDAEAGLMATGHEEARVKRAMLEASDKVVALATAEKLDTLSPHAIAPTGAIDILVTDDRVSADRLAPYRAAALHVVVAPT